MSEIFQWVRDIFIIIISLTFFQILLPDSTMPLRYNKDKREKPVFSMGLSVCRSHFNSFSNIETDAKI